MADYKSHQFTVTSVAQVSLTPTPAVEVVTIKAMNNPVFLGPSGTHIGVTGGFTGGFRLDPTDPPLVLTDTAGTKELFAIALPGRTAKVYVLRRPLS